jgi:benzoyl-CoA reductase/2-hydroxyglutaryl-CoA dehydratase subunit BcrC/BadD/HgdB
MAFAFALAKSPHTFSYDRLRYWIDDLKDGRDQIAQRILAKDPNDREIWYWLMETWCFNPAKHSQAYSYISDLAEKNPNAIEYQDALYVWYQSDFFLSGKKPEKKSELDKAIVCCEKMLKMTSTKMKNYQGILRAIDELNQWKRE